MLELAILNTLKMSFKTEILGKAIEYIKKNYMETLVLKNITQEKNSVNGLNRMKMTGKSQ